MRKQQSNYYVLHELSRHVLHSTETLCMALEVTQNIIEDLQRLRAVHDLAMSHYDEVRSIVTCQKTLLQCEHNRSRALEARLRNEIDLVS